MSRQSDRIRRLTTDALLISLALVLSIAERWIPLELLIPVPGIKLGMANIVTLVAVLCLYPIDAIALVTVRSLILGLISGLTTFLFSLSGGLLALMVMWLAGKLYDRVFSVIGISLVGAAAHNIGQIFVAGFILREPLLMTTYLPVLLLTSLVTGTLIGVAALPVIRWFTRSNQMKAIMKPVNPTSSGNRPDPLETKHPAQHNGSDV
jgi:heptaprenyl diphosphate synthase